MKSEVLFEETQRFKQSWLWLILLSINAFFIFVVVKQLLYGETFGNRPLSDGALIAIFVLTALISLLFLSFKLTTKITTEGIFVQFSPLHFSPKFYAFTTLSKAETRTYSALLEYGGWGLRLGFFGKGIAYTTNGNKGLQLEFKDGKNLLIGTQKEAELKRVLKEIETRSGSI